MCDDVHRGRGDCPTALLGGGYTSRSAHGSVALVDDTAIFASADCRLREVSPRDPIWGQFASAKPSRCFEVLAMGPSMGCRVMIIGVIRRGN